MFSYIAGSSTDIASRPPITTTPLSPFRTGVDAIIIATSLKVKKVYIKKKNEKRCFKKDILEVVGREHVAAGVAFPHQAQFVVVAQHRPAVSHDDDHLRPPLSLCPSFLWEGIQIPRSQSNRPPSISPAQRSQSAGHFLSGLIWFGLIRQTKTKNNK